MHIYKNCDNWMHYIWFWVLFLLRFFRSDLSEKHRKERQVCITAHLTVYAFQMSTLASAMLHISCIFHQIFMQYRHANDTKRTEESRVPTISLYVAGDIKSDFSSMDWQSTVSFILILSTWCRTREFYTLILRNISPSLFIYMYIHFFLSQ